MRLGIYAYATKTGLGYQTRSYYKHLKPDKTLLVDISKFNGKEQHYDWYENVQLAKGYPTNDQIDQFLLGLDVVLLAETPLNYYLYERARQKGIKTAVVYNYEFLDHFTHPEYPLPDLFIAPSKWNYTTVDKFAKFNKVKHIYLHHPVDREEIPFQQRINTRVIHVAGTPAVNDRNGTMTFMRAFPEATIICQSQELTNKIRQRYRHSRVIQNADTPNQMYGYGDILVLPRSYGGNCLPMNEALSSGMPVIMPDISPNNEFLPKEWLIPAFRTGHFTPRTEVDLYGVDPMLMRDKVQVIQENIKHYSLMADKLADSISWKTMKPKYIKALEDLCAS